MVPFGHGLWLWFARNPVAQGIAAVLAVILLWRLNNLFVARGASARARLKSREADLRQAERARETIQHKREEAADAAENALEKRNTGDAVVPGKLSDAQRRRIFGRQPAGR